MLHQIQAGVKRRRPGFTLIEMLLVVAILVALAGLVLPKLDKEQLRANKGIAANNMTGVSRYIQTYRIRHNKYPDRWDSLVDGSGNLWVPGAPGTSIGLDPQLVGGPPTGSPHKLTTTTLVENATTHEVRSLSRMNIANVLGLASSPSSPGNAFNVVTPLANGVTVATINASDSDGRAIIDSIYPENKLSTGTSGAIPSGKKLVVFGFGPLNSAIGDVLQECPTYSNTDPTQYYNRFIAIFECSAGGSRAELKTVVASDADMVGEEIGDYFE
ncbi:MAG: prepilin-type N-terminal cleavage/methylation domain-containing protein [Planctomycetota bacterium]